MPNTPETPYPTGGEIERNTNRGFRRDLWVPSSFDYDEFGDSFKGDQIWAEYPDAKLATGTRTFTEHNANGFLELKSGASTGNYAGTGFGYNWNGDRGVLFEAIIVLPATISSWKFEIGLSDADDDAGAVNQKADTTTSTATDYAVFILDTTENTSFDFLSDGASIATQRTNATKTLVASETVRVAIRIDGNDIIAWVNDIRVAGHSAAIEGGNSLTPWFFSQARSNSERILQIHKWRMTQPAY